jgi:hypothetical protein
MGVEGIFDGKVQEKSKVENVYFNLVDNDKFVTLELVDEYGNHVLYSNICNIDKQSGKIETFNSVNSDLGFILDSYGRVTID